MAAREQPRSLLAVQDANDLAQATVETNDSDDSDIRCDI
jgi:hypothetical protein